ncbi:FemAB family protein [Flavobacterium eburneipallidum]|uniref:FemAB family protein n=1 Tax=Flavobacterium eburneipallidum TaxID=3003263 RepID=UPI0022AC5139|nr:FemAB family protein [Flavobacterium eburneipallidum]
MKNHTIKRYQESDYHDWNAFIGKAKNATFLFHRDFMEYHNDRFQDYSLIVLEDKKWVAVLPANVVGNQVYSHQGLTYGGLVYNDKIGAASVEIILDTILEFLKQNDFQNFILKPIPDIYQLRSSNEIDYFLFQKKAELLKRSMNLAIDYSKPLQISKSKLKHFRRIAELDISIEETEDCTSFWNEILIPRLNEKYESNPVHSLEEINQLKLNFPENIKQFNAYFEGEIVAGITLFYSQQVVKSQYGATSLKGESIRALDFLFITLIEKYATDYSFFDMGIVDANDSYNKGLLKQKEELGCAVYLQDVYKITIV